MSERNPIEFGYSPESHRDDIGRFDNNPETTQKIIALLAQESIHEGAITESYGSSENKLSKADKIKILADARATLKH